jgi:hypothetical protein
MECMGDDGAFDEWKQRLIDWGWVRNAKKEA